MTSTSSHRGGGGGEGREGETHGRHHCYCSLEGGPCSRDLRPRQLSHRKGEGEEEEEGGDTGRRRDEQDHSPDISEKERRRSGKKRHEKDSRPWSFQAAWDIGPLRATYREKKGARYSQDSLISLLKKKKKARGGERPARPQFDPAPDRLHPRRAASSPPLRHPKKKGGKGKNLTASGGGRTAISSY